MVGSMSGVDPTQSYGKNTKSPIQDFHRFCYKNLLKFIFGNNSHNYLLFSDIIVWFYNIFMILNWNSEKISWKYLENFSFYQNFQLEYGEWVWHWWGSMMVKNWRKFVWACCSISFELREYVKNKTRLNSYRIWHLWQDESLTNKGNKIWPHMKPQPDGT